VKTLINRRSPDVFLLVAALVVLIFFALLERKEERYIISFLPIFATAFGMGIYELRKWINSEKIIPIVVSLFVVMNLVGGLQQINYDRSGGVALTDAGHYLDKVVAEDAKILTQNMPVVYYTTGNQVVYFPQDPSTLNLLIAEQNIQYILLEAREPTYPDYVWASGGTGKTPSEVFSSFTLDKTFQENGQTFVWVYKVF
jgi:hypothetical protein